VSLKPSPIVAIIASLALAACSSIGTINSQRLDKGAAPAAAPNDGNPAPHYWHPCEDFEWLCVVGIGGLIALIVVAATVPGSHPGPGAAQTTP